MLSDHWLMSRRDESSATILMKNRHVKWERKRWLNSKVFMLRLWKSCKRHSNRWPNPATRTTLHTPNNSMKSQQSFVHVLTHFLRTITHKCKIWDNNTAICKVSQMLKSKQVILRLKSWGRLKKRKSTSLTACWSAAALLNCTLRAICSLFRISWNVTWTLRRKCTKWKTRFV